jgi:hypothetical protein
VYFGICNHLQSWGVYENDPWKGLRPPLLLAVDLSQFISRDIDQICTTKHAFAVTVGPIKFSSRQAMVAYELL